MKKLSIYLMLAFVGLFMAACSTEDNEFAGLKVAEGDEPITLPGITAGGFELLDLNDFTLSEALDVQAFTVSDAALPEGVELGKAEIVLSDGTVIPATVDGKVSGKVLSDYVAALYGRLPEAHALLGNVYLYALQNGSAVKIDAGEVTFNVIPKAYGEFIYVPGNGQGWNPETAAALYSPYFDGVYTGYAYLDGDFKFTLARNWDEEYNYDNFTSYPALMTQGGGTNINCSTAGVYYLEVNIETGSIKATRINNVNIVGANNGWNPGDASLEMTWNAEELCYEISGVTEMTSGQWKFATNNSWAINLGANDIGEPSSIIDDLVANGKNFGVSGSTVKLYPLRNTSEYIYCTVE